MEIIIIALSLRVRLRAVTYLSQVCKTMYRSRLLQTVDFSLMKKERTSSVCRIRSYLIRFYYKWVISCQMNRTYLMYYPLPSQGSNCGRVMKGKNYEIRAISILNFREYLSVQKTDRKLR